VAKLERKKRKIYDTDTSQHIRDSTIGGASLLHGQAKNDPLFFSALAKGCKAEMYLPRAITLFIGLTDNLIENIFQDFLNKKSKFFIFTNKKRINVGFNKYQRIEITLSLYKKLYSSLGVTEMPHDIVIGSKTEGHIIIASAKSEYYPTLLREFPQMTTALIVVYKNDFTPSYGLKDYFNAFDYTLASMSNPDGHIGRLSLILGYLNDNLGFYKSKGDMSIDNYTFWWSKLHKVLSDVDSSY
jgi:hypothetical protein